MRVGCVLWKLFLLFLQCLAGDGSWAKVAIWKAIAAIIGYLYRKYVHIKHHRMEKSHDLPQPVLEAMELDERTMGVLIKLLLQTLATNTPDERTKLYLTALLAALEELLQGREEKKDVEFPDPSWPVPTDPDESPPESRRIDNASALQYLRAHRDGGSDETDYELSSDVLDDVPDDAVVEKETEKSFKKNDDNSCIAHRETQCTPTTDRRSDVDKEEDMQIDKIQPLSNICDKEPKSQSCSEINGCPLKVECDLGTEQHHSSVSACGASADVHNEDMDQGCRLHSDQKQGPSRTQGWEKIPLTTQPNSEDEEDRDHPFTNPTESDEDAPLVRNIPSEEKPVLDDREVTDSNDNSSHTAALDSEMSLQGSGSRNGLVEDNGIRIRTNRDASTCSSSLRDNQEDQNMILGITGNSKKDSDTEAVEYGGTQTSETCNEVDNEENESEDPDQSSYGSGVFVDNSEGSSRILQSAQDTDTDEESSVPSCRHVLQSTSGNQSIGDQRYDLEHEDCIEDCCIPGDQARPSNSEQPNSKVTSEHVDTDDSVGERDDNNALDIWMNRPLTKESDEKKNESSLGIQNTTNVNKTCPVALRVTTEDPGEAGTQDEGESLDKVARSEEIDGWQLQHCNNSVNNETDNNGSTCDESRSAREPSTANTLIVKSQPEKRDFRQDWYLKYGRERSHNHGNSAHQAKRNAVPVDMSSSSLVYDEHLQNDDLHTHSVQEDDHDGFTASRLGNSSAEAYHCKHSLKDKCGPVCNAERTKQNIREDAEIGKQLPAMRTKAKYKGKTETQTRVYVESQSKEQPIITNQLLSEKEKTNYFRVDMIRDRQHSTEENIEDYTDAELPMACRTDKCVGTAAKRPLVEQFEPGGNEDYHEVDDVFEDRNSSDVSIHSLNNDKARTDELWPPPDMYAECRGEMCQNEYEGPDSLSISMTSTDDGSTEIQIVCDHQAEKNIQCGESNVFKDIVGETGSEQQEYSLMKTVRGMEPPGEDPIAPCEDDTGRGVTSPDASHGQDAHGQDLPDESDVKHMHCYGDDKLIVIQIGERNVVYPDHLENILLLQCRKQSIHDLSSASTQQGDSLEDSAAKKLQCHIHGHNPSIFLQCGRDNILVKTDGRNGSREWRMPGIYLEQTSEDEETKMASLNSVRGQGPIEAPSRAPAVQVATDNLVSAEELSAVSRSHFSGIDIVSHDTIQR